MKESIFILNKSGELVEMNEAAYLSEDHLQQLLADYPSLMSGSQVDPAKPRRWLLVSREVGIADDAQAGNRWSLDHLFLDQDGIPTLVEVKRSTDTRIRREVIGQLLDYAVNAVSYWSINEIQNRFEQNCEESGLDPMMQVNNLLQNGGELTDFWSLVQTNLKAGKIRMLIVADTIPKELKRIIEFLNEQMNPAEILGIEIKQFEGSNLKTLVPRVVGMTANAQDTKRKNTTREANWTEEEFFAELRSQCDLAVMEAAKEIMDSMRPLVNEFYLGLGERGSMAPILHVSGINYFSFVIWTGGRVAIYFQHMKKRQPFDNINKRRELQLKLNKIKGVNISDDKLESRPHFNLTLLVDKVERDKFIETFTSYYKECALQ